MCKKKASPILQLLVIYALNSFEGIEESGENSCVVLRKKELLSRYPRSKMEHELEQVNDNVIALVLNKFSKEAIEWLYKE